MFTPATVLLVFTAGRVGISINVIQCNIMEKSVYTSMDSERTTAASYNFGLKNENKLSGINAFYALVRKIRFSSKQYDY